MSLGVEDSFSDSEHTTFVEMPSYIAGTMGNFLLQRADKLLMHVMRGWRRVVVESRSYTPAQRNLMDLQDVLSIPPEARTAEDAASAYEAFLSLHNQFVAGLPPEVALELCKSLNLLELYKDNKVQHPCDCCSFFILFSSSVQTTNGDGPCSVLRCTTRASRPRHSSSFFRAV